MLYRRVGVLSGCRRGFIPCTAMYGCVKMSLSAGQVNPVALSVRRRFLPHLWAKPKRVRLLSMLKADRNSPLAWKSACSTKRNTVGTPHMLSLWTLAKTGSIWIDLSIVPAIQSGMVGWLTLSRRSWVGKSAVVNWNRSALTGVLQTVRVFSSILPCLPYI